MGLADVGHQAQPIAIAHPDVDQGDLGFRALEREFCSGDAVGDLDVEPFQLQQLPERVGEVAIVVHDQDAGGGPIQLHAWVVVH